MSRATRQKILDSKFMGFIPDPKNRYFINKGSTIAVLMNESYSVANWYVEYEEDITEYEADGRPIIDEYGCKDWPEQRWDVISRFWDDAATKTMDYQELCTASKDDIVAMYRAQKELYRQNKNERNTLGYSPLHAWKIEVGGEVLDVRLVYDAIRAIEDREFNIYLANKKYSPVMFKTQYGTACVFPIKDKTDNKYPELA